MATVSRWGSRAPLPPSAAANATACAQASTQLLACLRHQATSTPRTRFPPSLSTSVDGVAWFPSPKPENTDDHLLRIHLAHSLPSLMELPTTFATLLRTQCAPQNILLPTQSPEPSLLPQLWPGPPPCVFSVAAPFQRVTRLVSSCFRFLSFPRSSCACSFSLGANRFTGMTSPKLERPPDDTATVTRALSYFSRRGDVSTMLLTPPRISLSCQFALYRALAAGLRAAVVAIRHSRGRDREKRVERVGVMEIESRG